jgi:Zn-dependent peptidase ImmA (M78 family)
VISVVTEAECRAKANRLLDENMVGAPEEIDLEVIAWRVGKLVVEIGKLETADGRLVAGEEGGFIRISNRVRPEGRLRFTVAHEIGHYCLHGPTPTFDTAKNLNTWRENSKETEANIFAGELLMPERLFKPRLTCREDPSLAFIDALAAEFRTSNLAAGVHFVMHTKEPCALVVSRAGKIEWCRRSRIFDYQVRTGPLDPYSAAGEIHAGKSANTGKMVGTPAGAWLPQFDRDGGENIHEDSRGVPAHGIIVTLLWAKDEWET